MAKKKGQEETKGENKKTSFGSQLKNEAILILVSVILALALVIAIGGISSIRKATSGEDIPVASNVNL